MRETPIWDRMVSEHGNPLDKVDKPVKKAVVSGQREQPSKTPRRKR